MNREVIIAMAKRADPAGEDGKLYLIAALTPETLARFAELVAQHEREACAAICSQRKIVTPEWQLDQHYNQAVSHCEQAIRLRGRK